MVEMFANSGDADQMPHSAASDLGLHCLPITLLGVSRLQWVVVVFNGCMFVLRFYGPVNPLVSCQARSVYSGL